MKGMKAITSKVRKPHIGKRRMKFYITCHVSPEPAVRPSPSTRDSREPPPRPPPLFVLWGARAFAGHQPRSEEATWGALSRLEARCQGGDGTGVCVALPRALMLTPPPRREPDASTDQAGQGRRGAQPRGPHADYICKLCAPRHGPPLHDFHGYDADRRPRGAGTS